MELVLSSENIEQPPLMLNGTKELHAAISSLSLGGAERIVLDWAKRIYPRWKAHLIVLRDRDKEWPVPDFVRVTRLHGKGIIERLRAVGVEIAASGNPVCVCHLLRKEERDALANEGVDVVNVLHNAKEGWLEGASALTDSQQIVAVSEACRNDLKESGWTGPASVIRHIPPRHKSDSNAREHFRKKWSVPLDATVIGMVGAVKLQKNYSFALRILKNLLERSDKKDIYLVIVGGPVNTVSGRPAWKAVVGEIYSLGLRNRVAMPGFVTDAARCLPAFDAMLNTSFYEGLSIATLEALISGLPVVASEAGGQGEINHEGLKLMPKNTPVEEWADALNRALGLKFGPPPWINFPSYRLWTLAALAHSVKKSDKVLFITANLNSGGAQRSLVNLCKNLKGKIRFEVAVAGYSTTDYFYRRLKKERIKVFSTGVPWDAFNYAEALVDKICNGGFGIVCFWNVGAKIKLLVVKTLEFSEVKFMEVSPGDYLYGEIDGISDFQKLICFHKGDYFRRINKLVLKYHGHYPAECEGKISVIPNGIEINQKIKTDYSIKENVRIALNGRIAPTKFIMEIIEAMKIVWKKVPTTELHVFGAAEHYHREYAEKVFQTAKDELDKRVFFHGLDFEVQSRLADFDAFIVLGENQGCPNALLEALVVGLPAVANSDGGTSEQLIDGQTGLLIKSCSPEKVAEALLKILIDRELAEKLGRNARRHVLENFSMEKMVEKYVSILKKKQPAKEKFWQRAFQAINSFIFSWRQRKVIDFAKAGFVVENQ